MSSVNFSSYTGCISTLAICWYAVAVQSKTRKEALRQSFSAVGIFSTASETIYLLYYHYLTYKTVNYSSTCIKVNLRLLF